MKSPILLLPFLYIVTSIKGQSYEVSPPVVLLLSNIQSVFVCYIPDEVPATEKLTYEQNFAEFRSEVEELIQTKFDRVVRY